MIFPPTIFPESVPTRVDVWLVFGGACVRAFVRASIYTWPFVTIMAITHFVTQLSHRTPCILPGKIHLIQFFGYALQEVSRLALELVALKRSEAGLRSDLQYAESRVSRADAEVQLLRSRAPAPNSKGFPPDAAPTAAATSQGNVNPVHGAAFTARAVGERSPEDGGARASIFPHRFSALKFGFLDLHFLNSRNPRLVLG